MIWFNDLIARLLPLVPKSIVYFFARHYIAGETLEHTIAVTKKLNSQKTGTTLDFLGESSRTKLECLKSVETYKQILLAINDGHLINASISVKPSQMGFNIDKVFCTNNIRTLVKHARNHNIFVRIDMEDTGFVDGTMAIFLKLNRVYSSKFFKLLKKAQVK
jgi:proline dehydrogenase